MLFRSYDYEFAPRTTTLKNYEQYTSGHYTEANKAYSASCQDGGAILFTSYYDMMARIQAKGVDDAYKRLKGIRDWYLKVYDYAEEMVTAARNSTAAITAVKWAYPCRV